MFKKNKMPLNIDSEELGSGCQTRKSNNVQKGFSNLPTERLHEGSNNVKSNIKLFEQSQKSLK